MGIKQSLEKRLTKFGQNNSPTVVAMGIAMAKGIFRPTFTMMDKKENYETKRYTALREGLTELIAIPVYYLSGVVGKSVAKKLAVTKNFMNKEMYKRYKAGDKSEEVMNAFKHAEELAKINLPKITTTAVFIGVCLSALLVIPGLCSVSIKPIMKRFEKKGSKNNEDKPAEIQAPKKLEQPVNTFKSLYVRNNYGMKVGGV